MYPQGFIDNEDIIIHPIVWNMFEEWFKRVYMVDSVIYLEDNLYLIETVRFDFRYRLNENLINEFNIPVAVFTESVHVPLDSLNAVNLMIISAMQVLSQYAYELNFTGLQLFNEIDDGNFMIDNKLLLESSYNIVSQHMEIINTAQSDIQYSLDMIVDLPEHKQYIETRVWEEFNPLYMASLLFVGGATCLTMLYGPVELVAWDIPLLFP